MTLVLLLLKDEYSLQIMSNCAAALGCCHVNNDVDAFDDDAEG